MVHDTTITVDQLETEIVACERLIGRIRAHQLTALRELEVRQVRQMDGSRSMTDWTAARLDVTADTSRKLMRAAHCLEDHSEIEQRLTEGAWSFDRAIVTAGLAASGAAKELLAASFGYDLAGVARLTARRSRLTRRSEQQAFRDRYLHLQPSLDLSRFKGWFELPGFEGTILETALQQRADEFPETGDQNRAPRSTRMADALVSVAQDSLDPPTSTSASTTEPLISIFMDGNLAAATQGESGAELAAGTRIGPATLESILCGGKIQLICHDGTRPIRATAATSAIPPSIRRFVLQRDGGCAIDGCTSRYRLQPHHIRLRSHGGGHEPDNLTTLCWYHHHVVIHGKGYAIDPMSPPQRRRLRPPPRGPDPP